MVNLWVVGGWLLPECVCVVCVRVCVSACVLCGKCVSGCANESEGRWMNLGRTKKQPTPRGSTPRNCCAQVFVHGIQVIQRLMAQQGQNSNSPATGSRGPLNYVGNYAMVRRTTIVHKCASR